jgi:amino acid adenylation domain-containing protein
MRVDSEHLSGAKRALLERRLRGETNGTRHSRAVTPGGQPGPIPLSVVQEDLWYFSHLAPGNPVYNELITIRKTGAFKRDAFKRAFNELVRRHEAWRTTFLMTGEQPVQVVQPPRLFDLPVTDLGDSPRRDAEGHATDMAAELARQPYQLDKGPLLRPLLVRFGDDEHRLYLALPHLIVDAVSLYRVVLPELVALYDSFAAQEEPALPEPPTQYADYARWSQEWAKSEAYARRMEYWRRHLEGAQELQLPLDHPRPRQQRFRGGMERVLLADNLVRGLRSLGLGEGATIFQVLASAFAVLLHRYTAGQDDVVFGIVSDLRQRTEFEAVVGYCFNPVVVRADLGGDPSFRQLLGRLRTELLDDLAQQVPFGRLVADLQPARDAGINPFFQAMLVLLPPPSSTDSEWSLYEEARLGNAVGAAKLDLTLQLDERPEGHIDVRLIYNSDLFDAQTAQRLTGHWLRLLEGIRDAPERRVSELEMLTAEEINRQVVEWNATEVPYPRDATVHELVARQVERTPEAVAVVCGEDRLTYRELDRKTNRLAHRLREAGADSGQVVGICLERSPDMVVGLLAILKSGAAYVPLDIRHPLDRLAFILEESGATVLLTQRNLLANLPQHRAVTVVADDDTEPIEQSSTPPADATSPEDLAYILYTSGSTGRPKGVRVRHRNVVNLMTALVKRPGLRQEDVVLAVATYTFDMAVGDIFPTLGIGARVVLASRDDVRDPRRLGAIIEASGATLMHATPTTWQMLLKSGWAGSPRLVAVCGGDTLSETLASSLLDRCAAVWNGYGPTETTVYTTFSHVTRSEPITIGQPIANVRVNILDKRCQPVAIGVPGEIIIGGAGVSAGYLNRSDETAQRFVPDPFDAGSSAYRTGDLGRFLPDGSILHLGRLDRQVKVRGNRIELGEVEAVLGTHPGVADAVVLAREDGESGGERSLVAYVVPSADPGPQLAELRSHLMTQVPNYMVPSAFVMLEALPLTPSGKIDRRALPAAEAGRLGAEATYVAPRTNVEERVAAIWARALGLERVGVHDDFFEIGGHSLLAVRLLDEMEREFGVVIPLISFFVGVVTVAGLAAILENTNREPAGGRLVVPVRPHGTSPILFFVHADESSLLTLRHFTGPLGPDQRVMGLLPERIGRRFDRSRSIEKLALPMLASVRETQPEGPYYLAGFSLGGLLAYEMAGRLRAAGEEVAWLGVIDAATPAASARRIQQHRISWRRRAAELTRRGIQDAARRINGYLRRELNRWLVSARLRSSKMSDEFDWRGARALATRYACLGHDAPMDLFVTDEGAADTSDDSIGWGDIHEGALRVHRVHGDHLSIVTEPDVLALANSVTESLRQARNAHGLLAS